MVRSLPFQLFTERYDEWFEGNRLVYEAELRAVRTLMPQGTKSIEVGAGTGRFAVPLNIDFGIEPSGNMRTIARERGMNFLGAAAEELPFRDAAFGCVLMVTTICFLDDVAAAFREAGRVLAKGGCLVIGFVDRDSPVGQDYLLHQDENVFYREATFYSVDEVVKAMEAAGFSDFSFCQTIFNELSRVTEHEAIEPGYGRGSFVVIRGEKK